MNYSYSRNLRKAAMAKRVIILMCIVACLGLIAGAVSGYALKAHMVAREVERNTVFTVGQ